MRVSPLFIPRTTWLTLELGGWFLLSSCSKRRRMKIGTWVKLYTLSSIEGIKNRASPMQRATIKRWSVSREGKKFNTVCYCFHNMGNWLESMPHIIEMHDPGILLWATVQALHQIYQDHHSMTTQIARCEVHRAKNIAQITMRMRCATLSDSGLGLILVLAYKRVCEWIYPMLSFDRCPFNAVVHNCPDYILSSQPCPNHQS